MSKPSELILDRIKKDLCPITGNKLVSEETAVIDYNGVECLVPKRYIHF
jgi:hypothetical protein